MNEKKNKDQKVRRARLSIILPALLLLFTIGVGITNYEVAQFFIAESKNRETQLLLQNISQYILISSLIITFFALLVGVIITISIIKPLRRVAQSAEMVVTGNIPPKIDIAITDEMRQLGSSFNQLVDYLQNLFEERDHYILNDATGAVILLDNQNRIKALNSVAEQILQVKSERAIGKKFEGLKSEINVHLFNELKNILQNNIESKTIRWTDSKGKKSAFILTTSILGDKTRSTAERIINIRDISALENFYADLQRADTLATVGALAAGVSHEIRNPLASIKSLVQLIATRLDNKEKVKEYLEKLSEEVKRIDNVVGAILEMAEPKADPMERCDINRLAAEALIRTANSKVGDKRRSLKIIEDYSLLPYVILPPESMIRALFNILENAIEATPEGGTIRIKTRQINEQENGAKIKVSISNTGSYIPEENRQRVFQPFFTTKPGGKGLGLSIAYQIITYNGGTIYVDSNDRETTFTIEFPVEKIIAQNQD